jgi:hypothetical protein
VEHHAGIDVSLERSSVCVVDGTGRIVREAKVPSEPEALVAFFGQLGLPLTRVGLEAGPLVAMAPRGADRRRLRAGAAGDAARQGGALGDGGQDRPMWTALSSQSDKAEKCAGDRTMIASS